MNIEEWERANAVVLTLLAQKREKGRYDPGAISDACKKVEKSQETLYRWLRAGAPPDPQRERFELQRHHKIELMAANGRRRQAYDRLVEQGLVTCSLRTFEKAYERDMTAREKAYAEFGPRKGRFTGLKLIRIEVGRGVCFEGDHKQAEVWIQSPDSSQLVRPWITVFIETWSRAIAGIAISIRPNQSSILTSMKVSMGEQPHRSPKTSKESSASDDDPPNENVIGALGSAFNYWPSISPVNCIPHVLRLDRGLDFMANAINDTCINLDIEIEHTEAYMPNQKGKIERVFGSFRTMLFSKMPYYTLGPIRKDGRLDVPKSVEPLSYVMFVQQVLDWVRFYNYEHIHGELDKTPTARWNEGRTPLRVPDPEDLQRFLLKEFRPKVLDGRGIMMHRRWYICADADAELGTKVEVRGLPHDERKYELYSLRTGKWIGTAWDQNEASEAFRDNVRTVDKAERKKARGLYEAGRKSEEARWAASVAAETPEQTNLIPRPEYERILREHENPKLDLIGSSEKRDEVWEG